MKANEENRLCMPRAGYFQMIIEMRKETQALESACSQLFAPDLHYYARSDSGPILVSFHLPSSLD